MKKWLLIPLVLTFLTGCSYFANTAIEEYITSKQYETGASIQMYDAFIEEVESKYTDKKNYKELIATLNVQSQIQNEYFDRIRFEKVENDTQAVKKIITAYFDQKINNIHTLKGALETNEVSAVKQTIDSIKIKEEEMQKKTISDLNVILSKEKLEEIKTLQPEVKKDKKK